MTPPPGLSQAAPAKLVAPRSRLGTAATSVVGRLLGPRPDTGIGLCIDLGVLYLAAAVALVADPVIRSSWLDRGLVLAFPLAVLAIMNLRLSSDERLKDSLLDLVAQVLGSVSLAAMLTLAAESLFVTPHPLALALRLWLFGVVYLGIERGVLFSLRRQAMRTDAFSTPTLIVGAGVIGSHLVMRLATERGYGLRPVGFLDADPMPATGVRPSSVPVLGGPDDLVETIKTTGARHVILAFSSEPDHVLVAKVRACQQLGVEVSLVPRLYETINERTSLGHVGGLPLLTLHNVDPRGWQFALKHAFDRLVAAVTLLVMSPVMLAIAVAIRLSSPGPILFRQRRVGRDGHEFDLLKFRTMYRLEPAPGSFVPTDGYAPGGVEGLDRRTSVGRFLREISLDELPQLVNVLRGDMSVVGPRPERPEFVQLFVRDVAHYEDRHRVKSGITGWAQVHGLRGQTSIADRVEWDNYYIQNWSLRLDVRILALTVVELLRFRG
jgi:exopolysaccharide biosynthesis polyprenyl glycosylphosphotransferase